MSFTLGGTQRDKETGALDMDRGARFAKPRDGVNHVNAQDGVNSTNAIFAGITRKVRHGDWLMLTVQLNMHAPIGKRNMGNENA